ncbi:hypothetical protein ACFSLT_28305 [Novosphingobium resinovorum]
MTADDFTLRDLALPATIPTLAAIEAQLRADPPPLPAEREHLLRLRPLVGRYEELRSRSLGIGVPEGLARSPQDQRELLEVSRQLGELLDIRVREVTVTGPTISAGGGEAFSARIGASSVAVRGIHGAVITEREDRPSPSRVSAPGCGWLPMGCMSRGSWCASSTCRPSTTTTAPITSGRMA